MKPIQSMTAKITEQIRNTISRIMQVSSRKNKRYLAAKSLIIVPSLNGIPKIKFEFYRLLPLVAIDERRSLALPPI